MAACDYAGRWGRSFFDDIASLHSHLGLVVARTSNFVAYFGLTSVAAGPQIEIIGNVPSTDELMKIEGEESVVELAGVFHAVLVAAQSVLGWDGISSACVLPPMGTPLSEDGTCLPTLCRIVQRGRYDADISDISANELFETPAVATDLFDASAAVKAYILSESTS